MLGKDSVKMILVEIFRESWTSAFYGLSPLTDMWLSVYVPLIYFVAFPFHMMLFHFAVSHYKLLSIKVFWYLMLARYKGHNKQLAFKTWRIKGQFLSLGLSQQHICKLRNQVEFSTSQFCEQKIVVHTLKMDTAIRERAWAILFLLSKTTACMSCNHIAQK